MNALICMRVLICVGIFLLLKLAHACKRVCAYFIIQLKCRSSGGQYVCVLKEMMVMFRF